MKLGFNWPSGFRVEKMSEHVNGGYVNGKLFCHSMESNSQENLLIWPKFELIQDFMPVLLTCKSD